MKKILLFLSVMALAACSQVKECPVLEIEGGKIQGVTADKEGVYVYKGIPSAAPPIG